MYNIIKGDTTHAFENLSTAIQNAVDFGLEVIHQQNRRSVAYIIQDDAGIKIRTVRVSVDICVENPLGARLAWRDPRKSGK